jgi:hypothetical protein
MDQLLFLLIVLACPLMMVFMMRGMHGGHVKAQDAPATPRATPDGTVQDTRSPELEREVGPRR